MRLQTFLRKTLSLAFAITALLLGAAFCHEAGATGTNLPSSDTASREIELRLQRQRNAVGSGNPAEIIEASRRLAALALREIGEWRSRETAHSQAVALYRSSLQLEDNFQTRQLLADAEVRAGERAQIFEQSVDPAAPVGESATATAKLTPTQLQQGNVREKRLRRILGIAYNDWGTAEARQELYQEAISHFREAERWDSSTPDLMRNLGMAAVKIGDNREAVRALKIGVKDAPKDKVLRSLLAVSLFSVGEYSEAAKSFSLVEDPALADPDMVYAWAFSLSRSNQLKQATVILDKLNTQRLSAEMLVLVGHLYSEIGDYEQALSCFHKALQQDASIKKAHGGVGVALIRMDRPAEAVSELEAELKLSPDDADAQYQLAYALLQLSKKEQALVLLRSLVAAHPEHAQARYQLGKEMLEAGQTEEAIKNLEMAAKLDPDRAYVHYQLQSAYRRAGKGSDAERELKIYRELKDRDRQRVSIQGAHEEQPTD